MRVFNAAMREWVRHDGAPQNRRVSIIPSIERALTNAVAREMEALESRFYFWQRLARSHPLSAYSARFGAL